jgi:hypothetical protein
MAFDPAIHDEHPDTGLHIDKRTGFPAGLAPLPIVRVNHDDEYPKWVVPHPGHVGRHPQHDYVHTPQWQHHINRATGEVTVLVHNAEDEAIALVDPEGADERE